MRRTPLLLLSLVLPAASGAAWRSAPPEAPAPKRVTCDVQLATAYEGPVLLKIGLATGHRHPVELHLREGRMSFDLPPRANREGVLEVPGHAATRVRWREGEGGLSCAPVDLEAAAQLWGRIQPAVPGTAVTACGRAGHVDTDGTYVVDVTAGELCDVWAEGPDARRSRVRTAVSELDAPAWVSLELP